MTNVFPDMYGGLMIIYGNPSYRQSVTHLTIQQLRVDSVDSLVWAPIFNGVGVTIFLSGEFRQSREIRGTLLMPLQTEDLTPP